MENVKQRKDIKDIMDASKIGFFFFVNRGWAPLPWLFLFLLIPAKSFYLPFVLLGFSLMLMGESLRIWAVGYAGGITRTRKQESGDELITVGPYYLLRNPLYLGNMALYIGVGFLFGNFWLTTLAFVFFLTQYHFIVCYEESLLSKKFGDSYRQYLSRVPRWLPSLKKASLSTPRVKHPINTQIPFSLGDALLSEKNTLVAILSVLVLWFFSYSRN